MSLSDLAPDLVRPVLASALALGVAWLARRVFLDSTQFDYLPGPPSSHWLFGNLWMVVSPKSTPGVALSEICSTYGLTWRDSGLLSLPRLFTADPRAIAHIFKSAYNYPKPAETARGVEQVTGPGLVVVEGDQHRRQRRVVSASFAMSEVKQYTSLFVEKAHTLVDLLNDQLLASPGQHIDMAKQLARCTLDIIGLAGFDHDLGCMSAVGADKERDLSSLFGGNLAELTIWTVLLDKLGLYRVFPTERMKLNKVSLTRLQQVGREIVARKKAEILSSKISEKIQKDDLGTRDLLTRIMRANLADDLPESQRLSDEELVAQITTFLFAGFETTSTALSLTLELLSTRPEIQDRLRQELRSVQEDSPSLDTLNDLLYLDAVVKESLRIRPPVSITFRQANQDDVLPLSVPVKNLRTGEMIHEIPIRKGAQLAIPMVTLNTSEDTWGPDAMVFNPDRWLKPLPATTAELAPFWSHQATFVAGPRACIGFRFALAEMKSLLFVLLRSYAFAPAPPYSAEIVRRQSIVQKPVRRGSEKEGSTMPLMVSRAA